MHPDNISIAGLQDGMYLPVLRDREWLSHTHERLFKKTTTTSNIDKERRLARHNKVKQII